MDKRKIYMVGNTHIDPVWLWNRAEGMQEVKSSFASALERLDEFKEFKFTHSSIGYLEWLKENCPEIFQRIGEKVREGRWEIAGGMWIEPDSNLPSGESVIRQFLYGKRFVELNFGIRVETAYNVDSFGHGSNLPAVYAGCGIRNYLISRPGRACCKVPPVFLWKAQNGSGVVTEMTGGEYMAWTKQAIEFNLSESLLAMEEYGQDEMAVFYGVGNHGGGPTIENIHSIFEMIQEHQELAMEFASIRDFFDGADAEALPVVTGELGRIFYGCYSSDNEIKRLNRQAEWTLLKAEAICSMAKYFAGNSYQYPYGRLEDAWKELLFNQFHDVLAGTSIEPARNEAADELRYAAAAGRKLIHNGVQAIANSIDTRGEGFPLLFFNPCGEDFEGVLFADVYVPRAEKKPLRIRDVNGKECAYAQTQYRFFTKESRKGILLQARVPAFGYAMYRVICEGSEQTSWESNLKAEGNFFTNGILDVTFDETTGCPSSIQKAGKEFLAQPISVKISYDDRGAWGSPVYEEKALGIFRCTGMETLECNHLRTIVRSCLEFGKSELVLDFILEKDSDVMKVNGWIHNHERHCQIGLSICAVEEETSCYTETCFLKENRVTADGSEYYQHRFADLTDSSMAGIAVFNTSAYGMRMKGREYVAILSRSSMFARGSDGPEERTMKNRFMDQGAWEFQMGLLVHEKAADSKRLFQLADQMHMPIEYLGDSNHKGSRFLRQDEAFSVQGEGIKVSALKGREGAEGSFVLRLFETEGRETPGAVRAGSKNRKGTLEQSWYQIKLGPYDIKTLVWDGVLWKETDSIEMNLTESGTIENEAYT